MKYFKIVIAIILSVSLDSTSYGANESRIDTASIVFAVAKRINDSIIVHHDITTKIKDSDLKMVEDKLFNHAEVIDGNKVGFDLATRIAFCKEAFFLNENDKDKPIGYLPRSASAKPSTPMESLIFVTSELNPGKGDVLVFISAVSPARFTVFSIDNSYHINILYDSFQKNILKDTTIGSVENITTIKKGVFRASERNDILNERLWPTPRQILISINKDEFKMEIIGGSNSEDCKE
jgi:hypothetical protein